MITLNTLQPDRVRSTFDCYGTLIDWETGIWNAFCEAARHDGVTLERTGDRGLPRDRAPGRGRALPAVSRGAGGDRAPRRGGVRVDDLRGAGGLSLPAAWVRPPFRDTNPALERMAGRVRWGSCPTSTRDSSTGPAVGCLSTSISGSRRTEWSRTARPRTEAARPSGILGAGSTSPRACSTTWRRRTASSVPVVWVNPARAG